MADWLKAFRVGKGGTIIAINEQPAGGLTPAIRLEARVGGSRFEETFHFSSQAKADAEFSKIDVAAAGHWLERLAVRAMGAVHA